MPLFLKCAPLLDVTEKLNDNIDQEIMKEKNKQLVKQLNAVRN